MPFYKDASFYFCILLVIIFLNADEQISDPKPTKATTHAAYICMMILKIPLFSVRHCHKHKFSIKLYL